MHYQIIIFILLMLAMMLLLDVLHVLNVVWIFIRLKKKKKIYSGESRVGSRKGHINSCVHKNLIHTIHKRERDRCTKYIIDN